MTTRRSSGRYVFLVVVGYNVRSRDVLDVFPSVVSCSVSILPYAEQEFSNFCIPMFCGIVGSVPHYFYYYEMFSIFFVVLPYLEILCSACCVGVASRVIFSRIVGAELSFALSARFFCPSSLDFGYILMTCLSWLFLLRGSSD